MSFLRSATSRMIAVLLASLLLVGVIEVVVPAPTSSALTGSGTAANPYLIASCADLLEIDDSAANLAAHYRLSGNVNCNGTSFPTLQLVSPETYFSGTLDGDGFAISNLTVTCATFFCGMFRRLNGGTVVDLEFVSPSITAQSGSTYFSYVGALAGSSQATSATIRNVKVSGGSITGAGDVGGLIGEFRVGSIVNATSSATVTSMSGSSAGGIVGSLGYYLSNGPVSLRGGYSNATVVGRSQVGGLVGAVSGQTYSANNGIYSSISDATVTADDPSGLGSTAGGISGYMANAAMYDVQARGIVTSEVYAGGIVGWLRGGNNLITRSFSSASVTITDTASGSGTAGGIAGSMDSGTISRSTSKGSVQGTHRIGGIVGIGSGSIQNSYSRSTLTKVACTGPCETTAFASIIGRGTYTVTKSYGAMSLPTGAQGAGGDSGFSGSCSSTFWDTVVSGITSTRCSATGKTTTQLKDVATFTNTSSSTGLTSAWDFVGNPNNDSANDDFWAIDPTINDGYPYLVDVPGQSSIETPWGLALTEATDTGLSTTDAVTSIGAVVVTGWANSGDSVQLFVDGVASGSPCTASAGRFTCTPTALPASGTYSIRAQATSGATVGLMSPALNVVYDTAVVAPTGLDLEAASDSGSSNNDDLTNDTTPTVSGLAEAGGAVQLYVDGVASGSTCNAATGSGAFSCTAGSPTVLTAGQRSITAVVTDLAGNVSSASASLTIEIDTAGPSAPTGLDLLSADDSGSSSSDNITSTTTLRISGSAEANSTVQLFRATSTATGSSCSADGTGTFTCTTAVLAASSHVITARATDAAGNQSTASASLTVTVDIAVSAPASLDLQSASDLGSSSTDNITKDTTPTFTAAVEANSSVQLYVGGVASGAPCTAPGSPSTATATCTTDVLAEGVHLVTMVQTDAAGNISAASASLGVTIDITAPAAPSLALTSASDTGTSQSDGLTNDTTPTFEGTAEGGATVQLRRLASNTGSSCLANAQSGLFACTTATLGAGIHTISAIQTDVAGNASVDSTGVAIEIDTTAPAAPTSLSLDSSSDTGASSSDRLTSATTLIINGSGLNGSVVQLRVAGVNSGSTCVVASSVFSCTTAALGSGVHSITAVQSDPAGNASTASSALSVTVDTSEAAPTNLALSSASDSGASNNDRITSNTTLTITGTAGASVSVQLYVDGIVSGSPCVASGAGSFSCVTGSLTPGELAVTAKATDTFGNVSAPSATLTVTVDTSAVTPSGLAVAAASDTGLSNTDGLTNDTTPAVTGNTEVGATVQLYVGGVASGSSCMASAAGSFSCVASTLAEGSHVITAVATDPAGNVSVASTSLTVAIDTTAPTIPGSMVGTLTCRPTWCDPDFVSATATPSFRATAPNDTQARLYIAGVATGAPCVTSNGMTSGSFVCATSSLVDGSYAVTAKLIDAAGNESSGTYTAVLITVVAGFTPTTTTTTTTTTSTTTTTTVPSTTSTTTSTTSTTTTVATPTSTVAPQSGSGRLVWHANSEIGSDTEGNGSAASPFRTFDRAYSAARAGDTIDLTGTFTWTDARESGDVAGAGYRVSKNLTIRGRGEARTFIEAAARENVADRAVFTISATVTISDVTIRHGKVTGGNQAGGIINRGRLTLSSVTISDNRAVTASQYSFYTAGGIFTDSNTSLSLDKVTVKDNVCECSLYAAGGVYALQSATKVITNSTFSGNRASASRIGPYPFSYASAAGAFNTFRFGSTVITNSTFFGNASGDYAGALNIYYQDFANLTNLTIVANEAALGAGGILYRSEWDGYSLNMKNVLLANNRGRGVANDFHAFNSASASRMTSSHNIVEASTNKEFNGIAEITGQQSSLDLAAVLAPNGTRNGTDTLLIGRGSVARDAGDAAAHGGRVKATPPATDQRGLARSGSIDIGAVENQSESNWQAVAESTTTSTSSTSTSTTAAPRPPTVVRSTTTMPRVSTTIGEIFRPRPSSTSSPETGVPTTVTEVTINPNIVATTAPTASTLPSDDIEDLAVEPINETEVRASNGSVELVLSIVDRSFSEIVQGRTGRLVAKQGLYARIRGKGFLAGSLAEVWVYSTPRLLAHLQVSTRGEAAGYVFIPDDMEIGNHRVELRGKSGGRRVVKATIPLTILDDGVPASTVPPSAEDLETALKLPTQLPAIVVPAPTDGVVSIGDEVIASVVADVLGESFDLAKIKIRVRINDGAWQVVDTSTGRVIAVVLPTTEGANRLDFEVTDEIGRTVLVQRDLLVEGTPQAVAYAINFAEPNAPGSRWWMWIVVVLAVVVILGAVRRTISRPRA